MEAAEIIKSSTLIFAFIPNTNPAKEPTFSPFAIFLSIASAVFKAFSVSNSKNAFISSFFSSITLMKFSTFSLAVSFAWFIEFNFLYTVIIRFNYRNI